MNSIIAVLALLSLLPPAAGARMQKVGCSSPEKTGWEREGLKGRVKTIRIEEVQHSYGSRERELKKQITFDSQGSYAETRGPRVIPRIHKHNEPRPIYTFDANCRPTGRKGLVGEWGMTNTTYIYDEQGRLKEEAVFDSEGRLRWKSISTFDDSGHKVEEVRVIQEHPEHYRPPRHDVYRTTRSVYKYDEKGNMIEEIDYKYDGSLYARYVREYDPGGRVTKVIRTDGQGQLVEQNSYKYGRRGEILEEEEYENFEYYFDSSGEMKVAPGKLNSGVGMFQQGARSVYEYDSQGNWTKRTEFEIRQINGETLYDLDAVTYRIITYF